MTDSVTVTRRRVTGDIVGQVGGKLLNLALGVGVTVLIARALGTSNFGRWATLLAIFQVVSYFAELGLRKVTVRRASVEPAREHLWIGALVSLQVAISVPAALVTAAIVLVVGDSADTRVAGLLITATFLTSAAGGMATIFQLRVRNAIKTGIELVQGILWAAAVAVVALAGGGLVALAAGLLIVSLLSEGLIVGLALRMGRVSFRGARRLWPVLWRVGLPLSIAGALSLAYDRIDQVIVFELAGDRAAGLYGVASRILFQGMVIPAAVVTTLFPLLSTAEAADTERLRRLVQRAADYIVMASLPALPLALVIGRPVLRLLFGSEFADAAPALSILMAAFVPLSLTYLASTLVVVLDLQRRYVLYVGAALILNVGLNFALVPPYGIEGAAWTTVATSIFILALASRVILSRINLRPALDGPARSILAATGMGLVLWGLREVGVPFGGLIASAAIYPCLLLALRAVTVGELVALVRT